MANTLNLAILLVVAALALILKNPLALFGLLLLKELPFGLLAKPDSEPGEDPRPIGFIHHDDSDD